MTAKNAARYHGYELLADVHVTSTRKLHVQKAAADGTLRIRMMLDAGGRMEEGSFVVIPRDCAAEIGRALLKAAL